MVDQRRIDDQRWVDSRDRREASRHPAALALRLREPRPGAQRRRRTRTAAPLLARRPRASARRRDARAGHGAVAAGALRWGEPVLDSAITAITPRGPAYRGRLASRARRRGRARSRMSQSCCGRATCRREPVTWPRSALPIAQLGKLVPHGAKPLDVMPLLVDVAALADQQRARRPARRDHRARPRADPAARRGARARLRGRDGDARARRWQRRGDRGARARPRRHRGDASSTSRSSCSPITSSTRRASPRASRRRPMPIRTRASPPRSRRCRVQSTARRREPIAQFADEVGEPEQARDARPRAAQEGRSAARLRSSALSRRRSARDAAARDRRASCRHVTRTDFGVRARCSRSSTRSPIRRVASRSKGRREPNVDVGLAALVAALGAQPPAGPGPVRGRAQRGLARARARAARRRLLAPAARALHRRAGHVAIVDGAARRRWAASDRTRPSRPGSPRRTSVSTVPAPARYGFGRNRK